MTLRIENLSLLKNGNWLMRDISFAVEPGEIFGLLAPDDENLTELLRAISGIDSPKSGSIVLDGKPIGNGRKAGFVLMAEDGTSRWQQLFSSGNQSRGRPKAHSGLVAKSLDAAVNVLLIENPVQSLDVVETARISGKLKAETRRRGLYTIIATNDPLEIFQLCDRAAIISEGRLIGIGTPEDLYLNPKRTVTASLLGEINLIPAKRTSSNKQEEPEYFTIEGEHRLKTGAVEKSDLGPINQAVILAIRPEHISISFGASFPEDNLLKARVISTQFRGPTTSIQLDANGLGLRALVLRVVGLDIGEECMVGLPPDRIKLLTQ